MTSTEDSNLSIEPDARELCELLDEMGMGVRHALAMVENAGSESNKGRAAIYSKRCSEALASGA